jgi:hypothetical protein
VEDTTARPGFYERLLPQRDRPVEALGSLLNGLGMMLGIACLFYWPLLLGVPALIFTGSSLLMARSVGTRRQFAIGFTVASVCWLLGFMLASWSSAALSP